MSLDSDITNRCTHKTHFFHPFCVEQNSIIKKIAYLAIHILTLGIPFGIYKVISCFYPKTNSNFPVEDPSLRQAAIESVRTNKKSGGENIGSSLFQFASDSPIIEKMQREGYCFRFSTDWEPLWFSSLLCRDLPKANYFVISTTDHNPENINAYVDQVSDQHPHLKDVRILVFQKVSSSNEISSINMISMNRYNAAFLIHGEEVDVATKSFYLEFNKKSLKELNNKVAHQRTISFILDRHSPLLKTKKELGYDFHFVNYYTSIWLSTQLFDDLPKGNYVIVQADSIFGKVIDKGLKQVYGFDYTNYATEKPDHIILLFEYISSKNEIPSLAAKKDRHIHLIHGDKEETASDPAYLEFNRKSLEAYKSRIAKKSS